MAIPTSHLSPFTFHLLVVANEEVSVVVVEVQAGAFAVAPHLAALALAFLGPASVTHHLEAVLPHIPEVVAVDVALVHVAADRGTAADGTVATYRGHLNAAAAVEEMVANLLLVRTEETLAGVANIDDCLIRNIYTT